MVGDLSYADCVHILFCNGVPAEGIAKQLFQFLRDILHIGSSLIQKICNGLLTGLPVFVPDQSGHPAL